MSRYYPSTHDRDGDIVKAWHFHDVAAEPGVLGPDDGPVWVTWHTPNYGVFVDRFDTYAEAVREAARRDHDPYYPCWLEEGFTAYLYSADPGVYAEDGSFIGTDGYPEAALTATYVHDDDGVEDYDNYTWRGEWVWRLETT